MRKMDTKTIFKIKKTKTNRYITVFTDFIRSKDLTPDEKYLIIYFLTLPDDWKIHKNKIWTEMNITFGSFRKAWNNLKNLGYISVTRTHKNRLVDGYNIKIYENPHEPLNFHGRVENEPSEEPLNFHGRVENEPSEEDSLGLFDKNMIISENPILPRKGRNPYVRKSTLIHNIDQHNGVFPDPSKGSGGKTPSILDQNLELVTGPGTGTSILGRKNRIPTLRVILLGQMLLVMILVTDVTHHTSVMCRHVRLEPRFWRKIIQKNF